MMLDRDGLVLFHNYLAGHCQDLSGNGNHGTLQNSEGFQKFGKGFGYYPRSSTGNIIVPASASLNITGAMTVALLFSKKSTWGNTKLVSKRDGVGTNYDFGTYANGITFFDGVTATSYTIAGKKEDVRVVVLTISGQNQRMQIFANGTYNGQTAVNLNFVANAANLYLGNLFSGNFGSDRGLYAVLIYDSFKDSSAVARIHEYLTQLHTPRVGTRKFSLGPRANPYDQEAVSTWNMEKASPTLVPDEKGPNDGTPSDVVLAETPWGSPALDFNGRSSQINFGNDNSLNFTTESFGIILFYKNRELGSTDVLLSRGRLNADGYYIAKSGADVVGLILNQAGASQAVYGNTATLLEKYYPLAFFSEAGGNNYVYLEGEDDSSAVVARVDPDSSVRTLYGGRYDILGSFIRGELGDQVYIAEFANRAAFEDKLKEILNPVARHVMWRPDFVTPVTVSSHYTAGDSIPETDLVVDSGQFSVETEVIDGKLCKVLVCDVAAGVVYAPLHYSNSCYGTWEFSYYRTAGYVVFSVGEGVNTPWAAETTVYVYGDFNLGTIRLRRYVGGAGVTLNESAAVSSNAWHRLKLERKLKGEFTTYLDGVAYVPVAGTNPVTDTTTTDSLIVSFYMSPGNKIILSCKNNNFPDNHSLMKKFGVEIP